MRRKLRVARVIQTSTIILALACSAASAAEAQDSALRVGGSPTTDSTRGRDADGSPNVAQIETVIVSAQKRMENLQDVPISAQVIDSRALAEQNQNTLRELTETVPGVHVSANNNQMFIRGIGSGDNPSFDQSVALFVDDIYHGRSRLSGATFVDLERIEILKGPQSTFFGNNAIAGALNIVSNRPGAALATAVRALYGTDGQYAVEGALGGPITDTFGARIAVSRNGGSGWLENVNLGQSVPRVNNLAGRLTLAWTPNDLVDITLKTEASRNRLAGNSGDQPFQWINCPPPPPFNPTTGLGCADALALGVPMGIDNDQVTGLPGQGSSLSTFEEVLTLNFQALGHTFTSVSGFYNFHYNANTDGGILPENRIATSQVPEKYHQFSQELRITSAADQPLEYLAGVYFQDDALDWELRLNGPAFNFVPLLGPPFDQLAPYLPFAESGAFRQDERSYAAFGAITWNASDRLKLNAGLRQTHVSKDFDSNLRYGTGTQMYGGFVQLPPDLESLWGLLLNAAPGTQSLSRSEHALLPLAGIQYHVNPASMLYLSYNRGFKAGGFNGMQFSTTGNLEFGPEHVNAYELGIKSTWLDGSVLLNLDVFRSDYQGLQVSAFVPNPLTNINSFFIRNAAESRAQGVELETAWAPGSRWRVSAHVTYLDSYFLSYPNASPTTLQSFCGGNTGGVPNYVLPYCAPWPAPPAPFPASQDLSGHPTDFAPKWSGSLVASYRLQLSGDYAFTAQLSPYITSGYFAGGNTNDPFNYVPGYTRLDGRLAFETGDGRWTYELIGKNLTDRTILTSVGGLYWGHKEQPRNFAFQLRYRF